MLNPFILEGMSTAIKFGQMIKKNREKRGFSQENLAKKLNLSRISINNYEQGRQAPNLDTAIRIALFLNIHLNDLVRAIDESSLDRTLNNMQDKELSKELKKALKGERDNEYKES